MSRNLVKGRGMEEAGPASSVISGISRIVNLRSVGNWEHNCEYRNAYPELHFGTFTVLEVA